MSASPSVGPVVHTVTSGESTFLTNAFVVECPRGVFVVDTMMIRSEARRVRSLVDSIGKPLCGAIVTHGHPDHYVGAAEIIADSGAPLVATTGVAAAIRRDDEARARRWQSSFEDDWPPERLIPDRVIGSGDSIFLAGARLCAHEFGRGESDCDSVWVLEDSVAFIGDLCFNGVHAFMNDGHSLKWLETLRLLETSYGHLHAYTGHGADGPLGPMCVAQSNYLKTYRAAVMDLCGDDGSFDERAKEVLRERMIEFLGDDRLAAFITAGATAIAAELRNQARHSVTNTTGSLA